MATSFPCSTVNCLRLLTLPAAAALALAPGLAMAADHACAEDASRRAKALIAFNYPTSPEFALLGERPVRVLAPIKRPEIGDRLDVLEVYGFVHRARYRVRILYAQGNCTMLGQEIVDISSRM